MIAESRKSFRVKDKLNVQWESEGKSFAGQGTIRNLSTTGALLEISGGFSFTSEVELVNITPRFKEEVNFLPEKARLIWNKRRNNESAWWGIEFIEPLETHLASLRERIQTKIMDATKKRN